MFYRALQVFTLLAAAAALGSPVAGADRGLSLPEPTGEYPVGCITYYLVDMSCNDPRG